MRQFKYIQITLIDHFIWLPHIFIDLMNIGFRENFISLLSLVKMLPFYAFVHVQTHARITNDISPINLHN